MAPYRILVVDDSAFMRRIITDIIARDPELSVAATAKTGAEALTLLSICQPDAITMDLEMPEMNGIEALKKVMEIRPTPVIMVTGTTEDGMKKTINALQLGAFDFIFKPGISALDIDGVAEQLLERLKVAVTIKRQLPLVDLAKMPMLKPQEKHTAPVLKPLEVSNKDGTQSEPSKPQGQPQSGLKLKSKTAAIPKVPDPLLHSGKPDTEDDGGKSGKENFRDIIAIGTSTGGPRALHHVLSSLPGNLAAPILVVQHMPPKFTHSLAQRLNSFSELTIREAQDGDRLYEGHVYIAPGGYHMELAKDTRSYYIKLTLEEARSSHRPSVDVLFESLIPHSEIRRHAVIMTGMGSDGADGMKALADNGAETTIAEAEETCVVYGMPRSAIERGAASAVLPLNDIAPRLVDAVMK